MGAGVSLDAFFLMKKKYPTVKMNAKMISVVIMNAKIGLIVGALDGFSGATTGANWTILALNQRMAVQRIFNVAI